MSEQRDRSRRIIMRKGLRYAVLASAILLLLNLASLFIAPYSQSRYDDIRQLIFVLCIGGVIIFAALTGFVEWNRRRKLRADTVYLCNEILAHPTNEAVEYLTELIRRNGLFALPVEWDVIRLVRAFVYASEDVTQDRKDALLEQLHRRD